MTAEASDGGRAEGADNAADVADTADIVMRGEGAYSPNGLHASVLAADDRGDRYLERWTLTPNGPRLALRVPKMRTEPAMTQLAVLDNGGVLVTWNSPGRQTFVAVDPTGERRTLGELDFSLRLLPGAGTSEWAGTALRTGVGGASIVYRIGWTGDWLSPVARIPDVLGGAAVAGECIHLTAVRDGRPSPVTLDPRTGGLTPLAAAPSFRAGHVLLASGDRVLLGVDDGNGLRLALASPSSAGHPIGLDLPTGLGGPVTPVALDPTGTVLALSVGRGAGSQIALYDLPTGTLRPVRAPSGTFARTAGWPAALGLWLTHSTPSQPVDFGWLPVGATDLRTGTWTALDRPRRWSAGGVQTLRGAAGPIEAVVCGPDWRTSQHVVIALHGGPDVHWTLGFDRLWQILAAAGIAVVAPNQRGSTGYGRAHADAIVGAWGGPDLADVQALARQIAEVRGPLADRPAVFGSSYGAFLALLAAAAEPDAWSGCAVAAPFRSAATLYEEAEVPVRRLMDRLRARTDVTGDALGLRDLDRLAGRIRTPVFITHGALDETIPVSHSRHIVERLHDAGNRDVMYFEMPNRGHGGLGAHAEDPVAAELVRFLSRPDYRSRRLPALALHG